MTEKELKQYLLRNFPRENEKCEWKEFKSLKHSVSGRIGEDVISYISSISNMKGGQLIIEGRKPNVYLSIKVLEPTKDESLIAEYITNKSFDDSHFKKMIVEFIKKTGVVKRKAIDNLIISKLSPTLTEEQKKKKVTNYLSSLSKDGKIESVPGYLWKIKA